ncbi:MAG: 5-(carboxyamino)imidazole ribonucleotide synthase [Gammaproteobacteria bacterium]|nr:5-(carboxyamino)imidazole ribonucleotide synthase [Gammaproteobacteria bacterium]|tara:strand:+ start:34 stop:1119 length:1086 start_codon:yes stop_codon:yes gene_type:complete
MRIGIIGAGQLGQMLGFAAKKLGIECQYLDPSINPPASNVGKVIQSSFDDPAALLSLSDKCDVITYEFENVPCEALEKIEKITPVYPPLNALKHSQDRLDEKKLFDILKIPLPKYHAIETPKDMEEALNSLGMPMIIKTRRFGYDGKGQFFIKNKNDLDLAWNELGGQPLIAEQFLKFDYEVSCIGTRNLNRDINIYPLSQNIHLDGILRTSKSPLKDSELTGKAATYVNQLLEYLDYVGVLALELFVKDGNLYANEFAPRVHNSGHWSIEGSETSQFENHIRAVSGLPLGSVSSTGYAGMINLIGKISNDTKKLKIGKFYDYGKMPREGRKLGHITVVSKTQNERDALLEAIGKSITGEN